MRSLVLASTLVLFVACSKQPEAPKAEVRTTETAPAAAAAPAAVTETLAFDQSAGKLGFVGSKLTGKHDGGFNTFSGELGLASGKPAKVSVKIDTASVWSDNEKLTGHLKSADFFDVEKFPEATFTSTSIAPKSGDEYTVTGSLSLHGVTKEISYPATLVVGESVQAKAEFSINRKDFDIVYPGMPDDLIRDDVVLRFDLNVPRAAAAAAAAE